MHMTEGVERELSYKELGARAVIGYIKAVKSRREEYLNSTSKASTKAKHSSSSSSSYTTRGVSNYLPSKRRGGASAGEGPP